MIKANNIIKTKKEYERVSKKLTEAEKKGDIIQILKYKRIVYDYEIRLFDIDIQLYNIYDEVYRNVFIDRYINDMDIELMVDKYRISRSNLYKIVNKAKEQFEGSIWV